MEKAIINEMLTEKYTGKRRFSNQTVWVSGAAQGIGRGIAEYFANEGAQVAVVDINCEVGNNVAEFIRSRNGKATFIDCDLNKENSIRSSIEQTVEYFGGLHILINNAAVNLVNPLHLCTSEEWDWLMGINLKASFLSFKYAYPFLKKNKASYVVNIGSISSFTGQSKTPAYIASKGAVLMLTKSIAIDYAADGIRCNAVCPGLTDTPLLREHMGNEELISQRLHRVPAGRMMTPKDIASTVAYLSCEDSAGVTGTSIIVDGGYLATAEWDGGLVK